MPVRDYYGFRTVSGGYKTDNGYTKLTSHNDNGVLFSVIADIIELEPEDLLA